MPEVVIKYKSEKALKALYDLAKVFDISIEKPAKITAPDKNENQPPITFAQNPDVTALAGIWEGRDISLEELRKEAWGDRI
ncbi:MAG: hypothetical protein ACXVAY_05220 [Mucilaginibacter sp.]